jgi:RNA polymerase sigma-70 factor (ECF subfamily)
MNGLTAHPSGPPHVGQPAAMVDETLLQAVRQVRAGIEVEEGFRMIDRQLRPRLLRYFRANSFSEDDAEDLVQKTLTRVYLNVEQLEQEERFLGWLFAIVRNVRSTALIERQREGRWIREDLEHAKEVPDPRSSGEPDDRRLDERRLEAVETAIEELPPQQRQCLLLRVRDEMSYEEIAETLRLSVNTVRNHLAEAKKTLKRKLAADFAEEIAV